MSLHAGHHCRLTRCFSAAACLCLMLLGWLPLPVTHAVASEVPPHAVVFMYHRFGEADYPATNITLAQFEAQLEYLEAEDFRVWPLARIVRALQAGAHMPDRVVAITVDDAYRSVYEEAFPRLRRRGWPFTVFVSTAAVDQGLPDYMSWEQMREMQRGGAAFANHSHSHDPLWQRRPREGRPAWRRRVTQDIEQARSRLRQELGEGVNRDPALFAYPYGEFDAALAGLVRQLGYIGLGQHSGAIGTGSDMSTLPRYPMAEAFADMEAFARKAHSLPLPVSRVSPDDPVVSGQNPPVLELTLQAGAYVAGRLACYASQQGRIEVRRLESEAVRLRVQALRPLPAGRARYNCTAPHAAGGRWYWYSHPWIIQPAAAHPAD